VAAVAVAEAVKALAPSIDLRLKWPNDILVERRKLAGLLCELVEARTDRQVVSLGVGLNILNAPQTADSDAARLNDYATTAVSPVELLERIEKAFFVWLEIWRRDGFEPVRAAWSADACGIGKRARGVGAGNEEAGVIEGMDAARRVGPDARGGPERVTGGPRGVERAGMGAAGPPSTAGTWSKSRASVSVGIPRFFLSGRRFLTLGGRANRRGRR